MDARFGALTGLRAFQEAVFAGAAAPVDSAPGRWWGADAPPGFSGRFLRALDCDAAAFRRSYSLTGFFHSACAAGGK